MLNRSRSIQYCDLQAKGRYLKNFPYLYCLCGLSPDVLAVISRMQSFLVISVRLVDVIITCVIYIIVVPDSALFYLGVLPCFVVIYA